MPLPNDGLVEVKDQEFLAKLKTDFSGNYSKFNSTTPLICRTIMNHGNGQPVFDRKLKMLKAPLYALLQLLSSSDFLTSLPQA